MKSSSRVSILPMLYVAYLDKMDCRAHTNGEHLNMLRLHVGPKHGYNPFELGSQQTLTAYDLSGRRY